MSHEPTGAEGPEPAPPQEPFQQEPPRREPLLNLPAVVVCLIAVCVGVHLVRMYLLDRGQDLDLILRFAFIPARYSGEYVIDVFAWIGPLSYSLLHGNLAHLAVNMVWLAAFGPPLANRLGAARFLAFWAATALGAVALHYALHSADPIPLVGASGSISGMMGAAARFAFRIDRYAGKPAFAGRILSMGEVFRSRQAVTFLAVWMAVNLLMGLGFGTVDGISQIAWEAHIGGFLIGFLLPRLFDRRRAHADREG